VIDPATSAALGRIEMRERDVLHAYEPGFVPESSDVERPARAVVSHDPLSVVAPDGAYFASADARDGIAFSRDGAFELRDGMLRTADGRAVLGYAGGNRSALVPLRVDRYDGALGRVAQPRVEADGTFSYMRSALDPRSGEVRTERVAAGRLALVRLPAGTQPERVDATHVRPPQGVTPHFGAPADGSFAMLATNSRDPGRVDLVQGLDKLREAYISYEALRTAQHAHGETEKTAMGLVK